MFLGIVFSSFSSVFQHFNGGAGGFFEDLAKFPGEPQGFLLAFYLYLGALWGPMGPQGGAKIPQNPFFTRRIQF